MDLNEKLLAEFERSLLLMDKVSAEQIIFEAATQAPPAAIASELVAEALSRIGDAWGEGKVALSQVYMSGIICEEIIDKILPPAHEQRVSHPPMAIGVFEDYHVLGKRIVYSSLRSAGFELEDCGSGLTVETLIELVRMKSIKILLLSVLMLPAALHIAKLVEALRGSGVKIIVGGAPFRFDSKLITQIGADGTGRNAAEAIETVRRLIGEAQ